jgi:hypothetical protein
VGDRKRVRFWKDQWFGTCSLAIQFWDIYFIVNEHGKTISEAWNRTNLKFSFRRIVNRALMTQWKELIQIASGIELTDEEDSIIWQYCSNGKYYVQTLYAIINDRRMRQVYTPVVWKIHVPSRIHIFYGS